MNIYHEHELTNKIKLVRKIMIVTGQAKGLSNPETIKYSEELDRLIYEFQITFKACS